MGEHILGLSPKLNRYFNGVKGKLLTPNPRVRVRVRVNLLEYKLQSSLLLIGIRNGEVVFVVSLVNPRLNYENSGHWLRIS